MAAHRQPLLEHVRQLAARLDPEADAVLLDRFARQHDNDAFEALMRRHGPMVLGVCRRVLGNAHDAEDVFQATFLVLTRRAAGLRQPNALSAWLHGVAHRLALKHRQTQKCRQHHETKSAQSAEAVPPRDPLDQLTAREMLQALDEELQRLREPYRLPLILCCLEGRTQDEAADILGWTPDSLRGRLHRGRALLHDRLARRGLALGTGLLATMALGQGVAVGLPPGLTRATVEAASRFAAGGKAGIAAEVVSLAEGGIQALRMTGIKLAALLLGVTLAVSAGGVLARQIAPREEVELRPHMDERGAGSQTPVRPEPESKETARVDGLGDPLPPGALARMGTTRLRHAQQVTQVLFAPDGKTVASGGMDDTVRLWDVATGKLVRSLKHPVKDVRPLSFSRDGKTLLSAAKRQLWLWDTTKGELLCEQQTKREPNQKVVSLGVSSDARTAASGETGAVIRLWDIASGNQLRVLQGRNRQIRLLSFSPDNKTLASLSGGDSDAFVQFWDVHSGKLLQQLEHPQLRRKISLSSDGKTMASGGMDGSVCLWDVAAGKLLRPLGGHQSETVSLSFSPDGKLLASGSRDQTIRLWEVTTGKELHKLKGSLGSSFTFSLSFSPDSKVLAVGSSDAAVRLWDVRTGEELHRSQAVPTSHVQFVSFSPDGRTLATATGVLGLAAEAALGGTKGTICLWDAASGKLLRTLQRPEGAYSVVFASDGKTLASEEKGAIRVWDITTGKQLRKLEIIQTGSLLALYPDGKLLAANTKLKDEFQSRSLQLYDVASGARLRILEHQHFIVSAAFSPDSKVLAVGTNRGFLYFWDAATGKELLKLDKLKERWGVIATLAFSADGKRLATGGGR
jgi:RNA polymerase sigma factor (sigma-70 family)